MISRAALAICLALLAIPAAASCEGQNLMAALAETDAAAHAGILERGAAVENGEGRFWKVERDGAAPSYLFGTVHSTAAADRGLPEAVATQLRAAKQLLVEITPEEQAKLETRVMTDPTFILDLEAPPLSARLSAEDMALVEKGLAGRQVPLAVAERLKPWMLLSMMAVPLCEQQAMAEGKDVLDQMIAARAKAARVRVAGLETYEEALGAFTAIPAAEMDRMLVESFALVNHEEDLKATLEALYRQGKIAAILEFNIWFGETHGPADDSRETAEALDRAVIAARNKAWLPKLDRAMRKGGVFAAFGALHLPGAEGVVELLRAKGYTVTRIPL